MQARSGRARGPGSPRLGIAALKQCGAAPMPLNWVIIQTFPSNLMAHWGRANHSHPAKPNPCVLDSDPSGWLLLLGHLKE